MATLSYPSDDDKKYITTSSSPQPLTTGEKTFSVPAGDLDWKKGDLVYLYWRNDGRYSLKGKVVSYIKTPSPQLIIDVTDVFPDGADPNQNLSPWDISNVRNSTYGNTTGLDLTSQINLNSNPLDIEEYDGLTAGEVQIKWNAFIIWITKGKQPDGTLNTTYYDIKNVAINTNVSQKTDAMINGFNQYWEQIKPPLQQKLQRENKRWRLNKLDVQKIQIFHNKTDASVQLDGGFIGTQTIRLRYPRPIPVNFFRILLDTKLPVNFSTDKYDILLFYPIPSQRQYAVQLFPNKKVYSELFPSQSVIPILWGNKRFILTQNEYDNNLLSNTNLFKSYDLSPNLYNDVLPWNLIPAKAAELLNQPITRLFNGATKIDPDVMFAPDQNVDEFRTFGLDSKNPWTSLDGNVIIANQTRLNDATRDYYDNVLTRFSQTTNIINTITR